MNRKKVLIFGSGDALNNGDMAIAISIVEQLKELIPDMDLVMLSTPFEISRKRYEPYLKFYDVKVEGVPWYKPSPSAHGWLNMVYAAALSLFILCNCICWRFLKQVGVNIPVRGNLQDYDMHIHCGTDRRITSVYGALSVYRSLSPLLFSILTKKPFIIYGETMGPFKGFLDKLLVRPILDKASLIMARDQLTEDYLKAIGVNKQVHLTADPAFLLRPVSDEEVDKILTEEGITSRKQPLIGITASSLIYHFAFPNAKGLRAKREIYVTLMAKLIDHITERLNATVVLFPHSVIPEDKLIHKEIYQRVKNKKKAILLGNEYDAVQIKGIIGMLEEFISPRMHAIIASTSMYVPSVAISYSHKYRGVLGPLLDLEKCVVDITQPSPEEFFNELCSKVDYVWKNREQISRELQERMPEVRKRARLNAELTRELLEELTHPEKSSE
jgi:colanic acid/amylovoran biosynthesis protein